MSSHDIDSLRLQEATWEDHRDALLAVRHAVFVIEQKVPAEIEVDEEDPLCLHVLALAPGSLPVGTARLTPAARIGRVAVLSAWRHRGIGASLVRFLLERAQERGHPTVALHAQVPTIRFYEKLGFVAEGAEFLEADIPHRLMRLRLT